MSELDRLGPSWAPLRWLTNTGPGNFVLLLGFLILIIGLPVLFGILNGNTALFGLAPALPVSVGVVIAMTMKCGNPLNWWSPFFGHDMDVNTVKIAEREQAGENPNEILKEIDAWVKNCTKGRYVQVNGFRYRFLRKGDAAFFKLAWG